VTFLLGTSQIRRTVVRQCKKPTAQTGTFGFADTRANAQKTKRACFLPTLN